MKWWGLCLLISVYVCGSPGNELVLREQDHAGHETAHVLSHLEGEIIHHCMDLRGKQAAVYIHNVQTSDGNKDEICVVDIDKKSDAYGHVFRAYLNALQHLPKFFAIAGHGERIVAYDRNDHAYIHCLKEDVHYELPKTQDRIRDIAFIGQENMVALSFLAKLKVYSSVNGTLLRQFDFAGDGIPRPLKPSSESLLLAYFKENYTRMDNQDAQHYGVLRIEGAEQYIQLSGISVPSVRVDAQGTYFGYIRVERDRYIPKVLDVNTQTTYPCAHAVRALRAHPCIAIAADGSVCFVDHDQEGEPGLYFRSGERLMINRDNYVDQDGELLFSGIYNVQIQSNDQLYVMKKNQAAKMVRYSMKYTGSVLQKPVVMQESSTLVAGVTYTLEKE